MAELEGHRGVRHRVARAPLVDRVGPGIACGAPMTRIVGAPMTTRVVASRAASPRAAGRPAAVAGGALAAGRWSRPVGPRDAAPGSASTPSAGGTTAAAAAAAASAARRRPPRRAVPATAPRAAARRRGEDEPVHHRARRHRVKSWGVRRRLERDAATPSDERESFRNFLFPRRSEGDGITLTAHEGATIHAPARSSLDTCALRARHVRGRIRTRDVPRPHRLD